MIKHLCFSTHTTTQEMVTGLRQLRLPNIPQTYHYICFAEEGLAAQGEALGWAMNSPPCTAPYSLWGGSD